MPEQVAATLHFPHRRIPSPSGFRCYRSVEQSYPQSSTSIKSYKNVGNRLFSIQIKLQNFIKNLKCIHQDTPTGNSLTSGANQLLAEQLQLTTWMDPPQCQYFKNVLTFRVFCRCLCDFIIDVLGQACSALTRRWQ